MSKNDTVLPFGFVEKNFFQLGSRTLRTAIYCDYVVYQRDDDYDFPVGLFLNLDDAVAFCGRSSSRYVVKRVNSDDLLEFGAVDEV